jgi:hypothetical protein
MVELSRAITLLLFISACVTLSSPVSAGVPPQICKDYFQPSGDDPFVDSYLRNHPATGMDVCQTPGSPGNIYYAIEAPAKDASRVCKFAVEPVYPSQRPNGVTMWSSEPGSDSKITFYARRLYATLSDKECPKQLYAWYVGIASNLPDESFGSLFRFLQKLKASRPSFDAMTTTLPSESSNAAKALGDALFGSRPPDSVHFTVSQTESVIAFIFYDAAFVVHLNNDGGDFVIVSVDSAVTWPGPDF